MEETIKRKALIKFITITLLAIGDILAILLSLYLAYLLRINVFTTILGSLPPLYPLYLYKKYIFLLFLWPIIFYSLELYDHIISSELEAVRAFKGSTISFILSLMVFYILDVRPRFPRSIIFTSWLLSPIVIIFIRKIVRKILKIFKVWHFKIVLVGISKELFIIENNLAKYQHIFEIKYKLDDLDLETLKSLNDKEKLDIIIFAPGKLTSEKIIEFAENNGIELLVTTDIFGLRSQGISTWNMGGIITIKLNYNLFIPINKYVKIILDRTFAFFFILFTLPIYPIIAILIKLDSKGPVLFKQKRVGKNGKLFTIYKFRTMYLNEREILKDYLSQNPSAKKEWEQYKKLINFPDPRVTRVGKILRRLSIDEFPQVFNILKGEMSLVGPRPYLPHELKKDLTSYAFLKVLPGITGLWQVSGRSHLDFNARLLLDEFYVLNWSLELDLEIILKTVSVVLTGRGAA